jgi:hypothetical protein
MKTSTIQRFLIAILFAVLSVRAAAAQQPAPAPQPQAEALARELMRISGAGAMGKQVMVQMIAVFRQNTPGVPDEFWTEFMNSVDPHELEELVVPIYVKNLSVEEMAAALEFYKSPVGQSLLQKMPQVMQESMSAGQQWGEKLGKAAAEKIQKYKETHPKT